MAAPRSSSRPTSSPSRSTATSRATPTLPSERRASWGTTSWRTSGALLRTLHPGVLATMAHLALDLVPGLRLHPPGREPGVASALVREPHDRVRGERALARSRVDLRVLGSPPRRVPRLRAGHERPARPTLGTARGLPAGQADTLRSILAVVTTFHLVLFAWVFFRAETLREAAVVIRAWLVGAGDRSPERTVRALELPALPVAIGVLLVVDLVQSRWGGEEPAPDAPADPVGGLLRRPLRHPDVRVVRRRGLHLFPVLMPRTRKTSP
jgi:hypothetical protein